MVSCLRLNSACLTPISQCRRLASYDMRKGLLERPVRLTGVEARLLVEVGGGLAISPWTECFLDGNPWEVVRIQGVSGKFICTRNGTCTSVPDHFGTSPPSRNSGMLHIRYTADPVRHKKS